MFIEIKASKKSLAMRKPVYGVAINDADYLTAHVVDGKHFQCPYYMKWTSMLQRCYSSQYQERLPTYTGCVVCKEWRLFTAFKAWMAAQCWQGMDLDKDIKVKGNKMYSPDTCLFIPNSLNLLLRYSDGGKGSGRKEAIHEESGKTYNELSNA